MPKTLAEPAKMATASAPSGVIILGGAHNALALARCFGRRGQPVVLVTDDHPLPKFSRYVGQRFTWPGATSPQTAQWLGELADAHGLKNWLILPCGDSEVRFVAEHRAQLASTFQVVSSDWDTLLRLCDKQMLARTAADVGIARPKSYTINSVDDIVQMDVTFPVILKPAMRIQHNAFTSAKAWQAATNEELIARYHEATALQGHDGVVVQELIPGGGEAQFSYAALWQNNVPIAEMTARRTRQYPVDFGFTSTYVEVISNDDVLAISRQLLSFVGFEGLVEVEYKFDRRTGTYKVIDVNPRGWSWLSLFDAADIDTVTLFAGIANNTPAQHRVAVPGPTWIHVPRDVVASLILISRGQLSIAAWLKSYRRKLSFAVFAWDDPLPALLELPLSLWRGVTRSLRQRATTGMPALPLQATPTPTPYSSSSESSGSRPPP